MYKEFDPQDFPIPITELKREKIRTRDLEVEMNERFGEMLLAEIKKAAAEFGGEPPWEILAQSYEGDPGVTDYFLEPSHQILVRVEPLEHSCGGRKITRFTRESQPEHVNTGTP